MKVLLSAFACAPGRGSEPGIGWGVLTQILKRHEVWVLTNASNRPWIERALQGKEFTNPVFCYVGEPRVGKQRAGLHYWYYLRWQREALNVARRLHEEIGFDLVQHITYGACWLPSLMGRLHIPFLWYAGSFEICPRPFLRIMSPRAALWEGTRNAALAALRPIVRRMTVSPATFVLSVDGELPRAGRGSHHFVPGALHPNEYRRLSQTPQRADGTFRMISIGRLLGWKGFHLGIRAFAQMRASWPSAEYVIVGDGPERRYLERLARRLGCAEGVRFLGSLPRREVFGALEQSDVLLHPSLHEQIGYVVLEAMAAARPVVCLRSGGPPQLVGEAGVIVDASDPQRVVSDIAGELLALAGDPSRRLAMGIAARERVESQLAWRVVGDDLLDFYDVIAEREKLGGQGEARG